ncbi:alpha/beta hydrolase [Bradyrhizobium sp. 2TAF24]|uniref:alpha/beta hydrolase n=1 Tax=Bradyrhizobium sp. 2TAF24 TaxID=3233011 RepID=UPI003F91A243
MPAILDPDAAAVLQAFREAGRPPYETLTPPEARAYYLAARAITNPEPPALASVRTLTIPGPAGPIPARLYTPLALRQSGGLSPCLVFFHGGGWVIGDLETHDVVCRTLALEGELMVISVDYRLAPEHKFPAAFDDAVAATRWVAAHARELGIDAARLVVGGDSAGGNLAAAVTLAAREAGPRLAGQVLIYPATDLGLTSPSHREPETDCLLTHAVMVWFRDHYLNSVAERDDWRASPARATNLAGLPPAFVVTAGADPLRDEGNAFARQLTEAGIAVTYQTHPGQFHGFITMGKVLPKAQEVLGDIGVWLKAR